MLEQIETIEALRERLAEISPAAPKHDVRRRALVPTMGALHDGHAALIDAARRECGVVVVSIFVNPLQFNNQEDLARYPRTLDADAALCLDHGADVLFAPSAQEVYPEPPECRWTSDHCRSVVRQIQPGIFAVCDRGVEVLSDDPARALFRGRMSSVASSGACRIHRNRRCEYRPCATRWPRDELAQPASEPRGTQARAFIVRGAG